MKSLLFTATWSKSIPDYYISILYMISCQKATQAGMYLSGYIQVKLLFTPFTVTYSEIKIIIDHAGNIPDIFDSITATFPAF